MKLSILPLRPLVLLLAAAGSVPAHAQNNPQQPAPVDAPSARADAAVIPPAANLPILGLAQVSIKVSNLDRSRVYYHHVLGFPEAFDLKDAHGQVTSAYFKVNDEQYVELIPGLQPNDDIRQARLVVETSDLKTLRSIFITRGLHPSPISTGPDGNPIFRTTAPNGFPIDFIEYAPASRQGRLKGKLLTSERISTHLLHAGTMVKDEDTKAFFQRLGWGKVLPGARGDYIETPSSDRNLETKNPPLDPADPATHDRYLREVSGAVYHISLELPDVHAAREELKRRGGYDDVRLRTAVGNNRHWLIHLFDPDGTRTEFMSKDTVPDAIPPFSVMPPGPMAPPILAKQRGVYPWP